MKKAERLLAAGVLTLTLAGLALRPEQASAAALEGLSLCGGVIIPSLFPFFVLSGMAVSLGFAGELGGVLAPLLCPLFRISRSGCGALLLGLVGGYPVGAETVRQLWESGQCSREEAQRLLGFCNNCGPAFLLGAAGGGVFGSPAAGLLLLLGHLLGACTVGVLLRCFTHPGSAAAPSPPLFRHTTLAQSFTEAVQRALRSTLLVSAYVVLFSTLMGLLSSAGFPAFGAAGGPFPAGLVEMTNGISRLHPENGLTAALLSAAFLMAFGGFSVLSQTLAVLEGSGLDVRWALAGKLLHGFCAALWTWALLRLLPWELEALSPAVSPLGQRTGSWLPTAAALVSWGLFLLLLRHYILKKGGKKRKKRV